jgi:phage gp29-like protein
MDIARWNVGLDQARRAEEPKFYPLQLLYNEIHMDALLMSQIQNRINKAISASFQFADLNGNINEELTNQLQNQTWVTDLNKAILGSTYFGHSLVELGYKEGVLKTTLIPRTNVDPVNGFFYPDYSEDKKLPYREMSEYGWWILEFGDANNLGLLNSCVPHVLFKRFAQSCWSELCEIYGIPPRYMKTNTQDKGMLARAERMMKDMGAAAWFIIDREEEFQFAKGADTNGDVYRNLIQLCNNETSMVISGAVIGQDTVNGNRSKDESAQNMLADLVSADLSMLEQYWNTTVIPALRKIGVITTDVVFSYEKTEDLAELWKMTAQAMPFYDVDTEWIKDKFGIPLAPKPQVAPASGSLSLTLGDGLFI